MKSLLSLITLPKPRYGQATGNPYTVIEITKEGLYVVQSINGNTRIQGPQIYNRMYTEFPPK